MSILIKGMEMPKDVTLLAISPDGTVDIVHGEGDLTWKTLKDKAISVPQHGRLIDASESIRVEFYDEEHEDWTRHDMTIDDLLSQSWVDADAPTIIPAEPVGESET